MSYAKSSSNKVLKEVLESGTKDHDDSYKLWTRRPVTDSGLKSAKKMIFGMLQIVFNIASLYDVDFFPKSDLKYLQSM